MQFTFYNNDLLEVLNTAAKITDANPMSPILGAVLLEFNDNQLRVTTNTVAASISIIIPASTPENQPAAVAVNAKNLQAIVAKMPDDTSVITLDDNKFNIRSGNASFDLTTFDANDFPKPQHPEIYPTNLRATIFKKLVSTIAFAVSKTDDRPIFKGVNLQFSNDGNNLNISAAATNMHRIAIYKSQTAPTLQDFSATVPADKLKILADYIDAKDVDAQIHINVSANTFAAHYNNIFFQARLIEGEFPQAERLFEVERPNSITFNRKEFKDALARVALVASQSEYTVVKLTVADNKITLNAEASDGTRAEDFVEVETGRELQIAFNWKYLADYLAVADNINVTAYLKDSLTPVLFDDGRQTPDFQYVITPVHI